ncbi:MAG: hypothetical protein MK193_02215 [Lentisphaeria bacterium]|nr:hypothetical protein [Lentisphaeria bacterium]
MPRPVRIAYPGAHYICTIEANEENVIFKKSAEYENALSLIQYEADIKNVDVLAYNLIDNAIILAISTPEGNVARFMQSLTISLASSVRHNKVGDRMFYDRYKSIVFERKENLLNAIDYVHVISGLYEEKLAKQKKLVFNNRYSSLSAYLGDEKNSFIDVKSVLTDLFKGNLNKLQSQYKSHFDAYFKSEVEDLLYRPFRGCIIGDAKFCKEMEAATKTYSAKKKLFTKYSRGVKLTTGVAYAPFEKAFLKYFKTTKADFAELAQDSDVKQIVSYLTLRHCAYGKLNLAKISKKLGVAPATLKANSQIVFDRKKSEKAFAAKVKKAQNAILK